MCAYRFSMISILFKESEYVKIHFQSGFLTQKMFILFQMFKYFNILDVRHTKADGTDFFILLKYTVQCFGT